MRRFRALSPSNANEDNLLVCFHCREGLGNFPIGFEINELVEVLDLQASVIVGDNVDDVDRLADGIHPFALLVDYRRVWCGKWMRK